jgi:hypothetical protein
MNSIYWKVRGCPFISELFEKTSRQLMVTPAMVMSAESRGQRRGYIHTHNSVYSQKKKRKNIHKIDFGDLCLGLICVKIEPKILQKKKTVAQRIPDGSPRKKSLIRPGFYMRGLSVNLQITSKDILKMTKLK